MDLHEEFGKYAKKFRQLTSPMTSLPREEGGVVYLNAKFLMSEQLLNELNKTGDVLNVHTDDLFRIYLQEGVLSLITILPEDEQEYEDTDVFYYIVPAANLNEFENQHGNF